MENEISGFISDLKGPKDNGWYGVKLENDNVDRLYSGFKKPDGVVKGAKVSVAYILKESNGKTYYNITGLDVLSSAPADVEGYTPKVPVEQVTLSNPHVPAVSTVQGNGKRPVGDVLNTCLQAYENTFGKRPESVGEHATLNSMFIYESRG